ncbi:MAG TPA: hypothetical protein VGO61_06995 [Steroidobacteraceae bacterium]|jgi:hypothetical protein|nr:hypothetical protein [Steroidobacteraceae bacterium]
MATGRRRRHLHRSDGRKALWLVWSGKLGKFERWIAEVRLHNPRRARALEVLMLSLIDDFRDDVETEALRLQ